MTSTADPTPYSPAVAAALAHNRAFADRAAERGLSSRPRKHLAVLACMDARLARLLPDALGLEDGDAAFIKVAGAAVVDPYGEAMRSLLVAVGELGVTDVMVVGHTDCGTCGMRPRHVLDELERPGVARERIEQVAADPRTAAFLGGFDDLSAGVAESVHTIRNHPLMPPCVRVHGFAIDVETGTLTAVDAS